MENISQRSAGGLKLFISRVEVRKIADHRRRTVGQFGGEIESAFPPDLTFVGRSGLISKLAYLGGSGSLA